MGAATAGDWREFDYDPQRSGAGPSNTGITARNVGRLGVRIVQLDGTVDSSVIELHGLKVRGRTRDLLVMTTTYGRTIALDAATGRKLWEYVPPGIGAYEGSAQITNTTPLADPDRRYVYAASPDGRIRKLLLASGHEVRSGHWPAVVTLDARHEKLGSALNIDGRYVVAVTGGYTGDAPPYVGHVAMIDRRTGALVHVFNTLCSNRRRLIAASTCSSSDSAIWSRAGAVIEPDTGRILVASGNGPFDGRLNWGDSVLELTPDATRLLHNWTPTNQSALNNSDTDLGSTSPALLPATGGRRLAVQGGKGGVLDLLDLSRLNGTSGGAGRRLGGQVQEIPSPASGEVLTQPAVWTRNGRTYVFVANERATYAYVLSGGSRLRLHEAWHAVHAGTSPVVAGGLLYVYDMYDGTVNVFDPVSGSELAVLRAAGGHWNSPTVIDGRVIEPVGDANSHRRQGRLFIYHLPGR